MSESIPNSFKMVTVQSLVVEQNRTTTNDLVRHFSALLFQSLFFFGSPFSDLANSAPPSD